MFNRKGFLALSAALAFIASPAMAQDLGAGVGVNSSVGVGADAGVGADVNTDATLGGSAAPDIRQGGSVFSDGTPDITDTQGSLAGSAQFGQLDTDSDGGLTRTEFSLFSGASADAALFSDFDTDGNGLISETEYQQTLNTDTRFTE